MIERVPGCPHAAAAALISAPVAVPLSESPLNNDNGDGDDDDDDEDDEDEEDFDEDDELCTPPSSEFEIILDSNNCESVQNWMF